MIWYRNHMWDNSYGIVIGIVWMIERLTANVSEC